ncbi:MAG: acylphosphatase [bacterium]|nr:acylphosphatase [bacterium]
MTKLHLRITGRVQGVGFRYYVVNKARGYDVTGFVRNMPDGSVETVIEGPVDDVQALATVCKIGPTSANVDDYDEKYGEYSGEFGSFEVKL